MVKPKIEDIAALSGVSIGTVDRVLHNREGVSKKTKAKVEKVIQELGYEPSIHLSALSIKRQFRILVIIPQFSEAGGDYWSRIVFGLNRALQEFSDFDVVLSYLPYNQYDVENCKDVFKKALEKETDAYIIGPTFYKETLQFVEKLEKPYVFVDSVLKEADPLTSFSADNNAIGRIVGKLLLQLTHSESSVAILHTLRTKDTSINAQTRRSALIACFDEANQTDKIIHGYFYPEISVQNDKMLDDFFAQHPNVKGIAVLASKGYVIADYLKRRDLKDIRLICMDEIENNVEALKEGYISYLICQRPHDMSFNALKYILLYFIQKKTPEKNNFVPIDILTAENVAYYR